MDFSHVQVTTTTETKAQAAALADDLVSARLAACVQVWGPIESTFWWEGRRDATSEWMCVVKTSARRAGEVVARLREAHPYENPEVTVLPIVAGAPAYLEWIDDEVALGR